MRSRSHSLSLRKTIRQAKRKAIGLAIRKVCRDHACAADGFGNTFVNGFAKGFRNGWVWKIKSELSGIHNKINNRVRNVNYSIYLHVGVYIYVYMYKYHIEK